MHWSGSCFVLGFPSTNKELKRFHLDTFLCSQAPFGFLPWHQGWRKISRCWYLQRQIKPTVWSKLPDKKDTISKVNMKFFNLTNVSQHQQWIQSDIYHMTLCGSRVRKQCVATAEERAVNKRSCLWTSLVTDSFYYTFELHVNIKRHQLALWEL